MLLLNSNMTKQTSIIFFLLCFACDTLLAQDGRSLYAQLIGNWEVTSTQVEKEKTALNSNEKKIWLNIQKKSKFLNKLIQEKEQRMVLEFDVNGTYKFVIFEKGQATYEETGSFYLAGTEIKCQNDQGEKSSYDNHIIISITENTFVAKHYLALLQNKAFETFSHVRLNY